MGAFDIVYLEYGIALRLAESARTCFVLATPRALTILLLEAVLDLPPATHILEYENIEAGKLTLV